MSTATREARAAARRIEHAASRACDGRCVAWVTRQARDLHSQLDVLALAVGDDLESVSRVNGREELRTKGGGRIVLVPASIAEQRLRGLDVDARYAA